MYVCIYRGEIVRCACVCPALGICLRVYVCMHVFVCERVCMHVCMYVGVNHLKVQAYFIALKYSCTCSGVYCM